MNISARVGVINGVSEDDKAFSFDLLSLLRADFTDKCHLKQILKTDPLLPTFLS